MSAMPTGSTFASQAPIYLLSIDGGAFRGLSTIVLLEQLMDATNEHRKESGLVRLEPWQMFDLMGGTGTGGLIAVMLGRLKMSISDCKNAYLKLSRQVFTKKKLPSERAVKHIIGIDVEAMPLKDENPECKVFVVAQKYRHGRDTCEVVLLRSYENYRHRRPSYHVARVWQACRATSAALGFFEPILINGTFFSEGGLHYNNPVQLVHDEASEIYPGRDQVMVSLGAGTGDPTDSMSHPSFSGLPTFLIDVSPEVEKTAVDFHHRDNGKAARSGRYSRFNVPGITQLGLDEASQLSAITRLTLGYLDSPEVKQKANICAEQLSNAPYGVPGTPSLPKSHREYTQASEIPFDQQEFVGSGAVGIVHRVQGTDHLFRGQTFARKQIQLDSQGQHRAGELQQIRNEVDILNHLQHPHIIQLAGTYVFNDIFAIITYPCAQRDLEKYLQDSHALSKADLARNARWFGCLIDGMRYLHEHRIQHRDIKPSNILIDNENVIFADFGISSRSVGVKTVTTDIGRPRARTPEYCAPEVEDGHTRNQSADIFSLGAVILEMLSMHFGNGVLKNLRNLVQARDRQSYARNVVQVAEWIQDLSKDFPNEPTWKLELLQVCRSMLHAAPAKRPAAADLSSWWTLHSTPTLPPCKCGPDSGSAQQKDMKKADINEDLRVQYTKGNWFTAEYLVSEGAEISPREELLATAEGGLRSMVEGLLRGKRGAVDCSGAIQRASRGGSEAVVKMLLDNGSNVNEKDSDGLTALVEAIWNGHQTVVDCLLAKGADVNLSGRQGLTPLCKAAEDGNETLARQLMENGADPNLKDQGGMTALFKAAESGHEGVVRLLLEKTPRDPAPPLKVAIEKGHEKIARLLFEVLSLDWEEVAKSAQMFLPMAVQRGQRDILQLLVDQDADVNTPDLHGSTALHDAAKLGGTETMQFLLLYGANINAENAEQSTPLHAAVESGCDDSVVLLLKNGARYDLNDRDGRNALDVAAEVGNLLAMRLLLQRIQHDIDNESQPWSEDSDTEEREGESRKLDLAVRTFLDSFQRQLRDVVQVFSEVFPMVLQRTLTSLIHKGEEAMLGSLLSKPRWRLTKIYTPTMMAKAFPEALKYDAGHSGNHMLRLLLDNGADPNADLDNGKTALILASKAGLPEAERLLIDHGADSSQVYLGACR